MKNMTLENICAACDGAYHGDEAELYKEVTAVSTDSRNIFPGCLFVAIPGERVDGHDFIDDVIEKGAAAVICERLPEKNAGCCIQVASSRQAIKDIAEFYRTQFTIPVVGITGSAGKTSTKEMIAAVLGERYKILKTEGNFNNELGVPLTVLRLEEKHEVAVIEMGISDFGEMHRLAKIVRPDICVITNIGAAHLENLLDRDGVLRAKTEIFDFLNENGQIVLCGDDDKLITVSVPRGIRPHFYGLRPENEIRADELVPHGLDGTAFRLHLGGEVTDAFVPAPGEHMVMNALAGAATGKLLGLSAEEIVRGIAAYQAISGRFRVVKGTGFTVIDDCYNANPASMKASIGVLAGSDSRKIAVLGDMGELGKNEEELHAEVGEYIAALGLDVLLCAGPLSAALAREAKKDPKLTVAHFETREKLRDALSDYVQPGDTILVKASHFMKFEEIVEALLS